MRVIVPVVDGVGTSMPVEDAIDAFSPVIMLVITVVGIAILAVVTFYLAIPVAIIALLHHVISGNNARKAIRESLQEAKVASEKVARSKENASKGERVAREDSQLAHKVLKVTSQASQSASDFSAIARSKANLAAVAGRRRLEGDVRDCIAKTTTYALEAEKLVQETYKHHRAVQIIAAQTSIKSVLENGAGSALTKFKSLIGIREENTNLANALMAMCALMAFSDDRVDEAEMAAVKKTITSDDVLKTIATVDLLEVFESYCAKIRVDNNWGRVKAKKAIEIFNVCTEESRAMIQAGILIGRSDFVLSYRETEVIKEMCSLLTLDFSSFSILNET